MTDCRIDKAIEYFEDDIRDDNFENYRKTIVTTMSFLIGVPEEKVTSENRFDVTEFEKLKTDDNAKIIRNLCKLRTQFLRNYKNIDDAKKFQMRPLESMSEYLDIDAIKYLRNQNIEVNITNAKSPTVYIAYINQYIVDNIEKIKPLIPDWIKFEYIKSLFLMPGGYAGHNGVNIRSDYKKIFNVILEIGKTYAAQRNDYPFQMYIHWPKMFRETDGNILYNDLKFLKLLYAANGDSFQAGRYVIDAKETTKENVYYFLNEAENVAIFVDCENVDPYAFASTILNLNNDELELPDSIKKVLSSQNIEIQKNSTLDANLDRLCDVALKNANPVKPLTNTKEFFNNNLKEKNNLTIKGIDMCFHGGAAWLRAGTQKEILDEILKRKIPTRILINTPEAAESIAKHMRDEYALYFSFEQVIKLWSKYASDHSDILQVRACPIPLLRVYHNIKFNEDEIRHTHDRMHIKYYVYQNMNLENSFEHELSSFSKYYEIYQKEFEFLWESSTKI